MIGGERDTPDAPACPLVGLAVDRRTRCTYPHPDHRCHAVRLPRSIKPYFQATVCLSPKFAACERYLAWQKRTSSGPGSAS